MDIHNRTRLTVLLLLLALVLMVGCTPTTSRFITIEERGIDAGSLAPFIANTKALTISEGEKPMRACVTIEIASPGKVITIETPAC